MKAPRITAVLVLLCLVGVGLPACGDDDDAGACGEAFDKWCACPAVSCEGRPASCTGPDKEWADCINAAEDACTASCD